MRYYKVNFIAATMDMDYPLHSYMMVYAANPDKAWKQVEDWYYRKPGNLLSLYNMGIEDVKSLEESLVDILKWTDYDLYLKAFEPSDMDNHKRTLQNLKKINPRKWQSLMELARKEL